MSGQICVYTLSGALLTLDGAVQVWDLKRCIKDVLGIPRRQQRLVDELRVLGNHESISQDCTVTLTVDNSCFVCVWIGRMQVLLSVFLNLLLL